MALIPLGNIPGKHSCETVVPSHAAATATEDTAIFYAPFACKVTAVRLVPGAAVTGANTNTTHLNLINRGADGSGTTELANYDLTSGNDLTAYDNKNLYTPASGLAVVAGGVLTLQEEKVGTGLLVPSLLAIVEFEPNPAVA